MKRKIGIREEIKENRDTLREEIRQNREALREELKEDRKALIKEMKEEFKLIREEFRVEREASEKRMMKVIDPLIRDNERLQKLFDDLTDKTALNSRLSH